MRNALIRMVQGNTRNKGMGPELDLGSHSKLPRGVVSQLNKEQKDK